MNEIILRKLEVNNFKGFAKASMEFNPAKSELRAENGQGKTTYLHAFFWLLGFNVSDVIPSKDNKEIPNLEIKVTADLLVSTPTGEYNYTFERKQTEIWKVNKENGIEEKVNNESSYSIDTVPFTLRNYKEKIADLFGIPYEKLQMLCEKEFFNHDDAKWGWASRRKELFELCHVDDLLADLVKKDCYNLIATDIAKKLSTTDIKKAIKKELAGFKLQKEQNAVLIADKQNEIAKYGSVDYDALEAEKTALETQITQINLAASKQGVNEELSVLQEQKATLSTKLSRIKIDTVTKVGAIEEKKQFCDAELRKIQTKGENLKAEMVSTKAEIQNLEAENNKLSTLDWSGDTVCPTCGQPIPQDRIEESRQKFDAERLANIDKNNEAIDKKIDYLQSSKEQLEDLRETYATLQSQKTAYQNELAEITKPNHEIAKYQKQIEEIDKLIVGITSEENKQKDTTAIVAPLKAKIREINEKLGYKRIVADFVSRVEQLKSLNKDITDREMLAKTKVKQIDDYVREQVQLVTDVVNGKFSNGVSFSLFSDLYAGSEHDIKEECICMLNGKTYSEMSYGERFFADLEVTKALQKEYTVNLPIFLDNAECYTGEVTAEQQLILLYAEKGSTLDGIKIEVLL